MRKGGLIMGYNPTVTIPQNSVLSTQIVDKSGNPISSINRFPVESRPVNGNGESLFIQSNPGAVSDSALYEKIDALNEKIDGIINGTTPAATELKGSNVEELRVFDNVRITDNAYHYKDINLEKYKKITILAKNDHDQALTFDMRKYEYFRVWNGTAWSPTSDFRVTIENNGQWYVVSTQPEIEKLANSGLKTARFVLNAATAPTTGAVTLLVWGVPNA
jgi:hypothetical protein